MANEKGVTPQMKHKAKHVAVRQQTLFDLFPRKINPISKVSNSESQGEDNSTRDIMTSRPIEHQEEAVSTDAVVNKLRVAGLEPRPVHPFFIKSMSQTSAPSEELVISDDEIVAIKSVESVANTLSLDPMKPYSLSQDGGSREDPIILDSSPVKLGPTIFASSASVSLAPIFAPMAKPFALHSVKSRIKSFDAPYPDSDSQHVRGPQHTSRSPDVLYPRRQKVYTIDHPEISCGVALPLNLNGESSDYYKSVHIQSSSSDPLGIDFNVPNLSQRHPAITRFQKQQAASTSGHNLWVDKWRPTCAEEVLGNESNAIYLRDWLCALELHLQTETIPGSNEGVVQGTKVRGGAQNRKRPRVTRAVERRHGRKKQRTDSDDESDWIVYSDESEDERLWVDKEDDGIDEGRLTEGLSSPQGPGFQNSFDPLTNTILLAGPSGTGKTAAVYACAEEMGWEVFEVYPGIGKRNGAGIDNLIGDVGKNHLVKSKAGIPPRGRMTFLGSKEAKDDLKGSRLDLEDSDSISASSSTSTYPTEMQVATGIQQSMILLEEVDILFKEDANFWPTVINFIKECKRPVICTCNDVSLIPTLDLPLQAILNFNPCPSPLAAIYLECLCSAEGYSVKRNSVFQLYNSGYVLDRLDLPNTAPSSGLANSSAPDLRRTINYLQLQCSSANTGLEHTGPHEPQVDSIDDLYDWDWCRVRHRNLSDGFFGYQSSFATRTRSTRGLAASHADLVSFADSHLTRDPWDTPEALALSSREASADDEVGYVILFGPRRRTCSSFGYLDRDEEMASAALRLSRGTLGMVMTEQGRSIGTYEVFQARVEYQRQIAEALNTIVPRSVLTQRRSSVYADYVPCVRAIVTGEDKQEAVTIQKETSGRTTRNSKRGMYVRSIALTAEERRVLDETRLRE